MTQTYDMSDEEMDALILAGLEANRRWEQEERAIMLDNLLGVSEMLAEEEMIEKIINDCINKLTEVIG